MHLDEAADDERIEHRYVATLFLQVVSDRQTVGAGRFQHKQAVRPTRLHQLLKAGFAVADFQVLDLFLP